jgi:3-hydroxy-9,10-secoandrosta-1,3,5(10)-triene-9,17-dione monooxygenase reductase component
VAIGEDLFKSCMGSWPSGVTVVTTISGEQIHGMTVSDFSGASLSPPLVTICCNRESTTTRLIAEGGRFAVNILAADQQELSNRFASKKLETVRFEGVEYQTGKTGVPLLAGAVANLDCSKATTGAPLIPGAVTQIDCTLEATFDAGDHVIYLGRIEYVNVEDREPLLYWSGGYRELASGGAE